MNTLNHASSADMDSLCVCVYCFIQILCFVFHKERTDNEHNVHGGARSQCRTCPLKEMGSGVTRHEYTADDDGSANCTGVTLAVVSHEPSRREWGAFFGSSKTELGREAGHLAV